MAGRSKPALAKAIARGRLSAGRDDRGQWQIDPAELSRVYPPVSSQVGDSLPTVAAVATDTAAELREVRARLADAQETIADLRRRLDQEAEERRQAQTRLTALLTDRHARAAEPTTVLPDPLSPFSKLPEPEAAASPSPRRRWWHWW